MTNAQLSPTPVFKAFDNNGIALANGLLYSYAAGTTTPQATYPSQSETTPNTNPIVLNARGECALWLDPTLSYKLNLTDSSGNQIPGWPVDNIQGIELLLTSAVEAIVTPTYIGQAIWPQTTAEVSAGITPSSYDYPPGDVRRYGADPTGALASDSAFTQAFSVAGTDDYVIDGIYKVTVGNLTIPSGATVRWTGDSVVNYTGSGSCFLISNSKNIALWRPNVSLNGAGNAAIAFDIAGIWFLSVYQPLITGGQTLNTQTGFQIQTSRTGGNNFGAYTIQIFNPDFATGKYLQYGIRTLRTSGDSTDVTHLDVYGGWSSYVTYPIYFRNLSTFRIIGFTPEQCTDGLNLSNCDNGFLQPGEMDCSGYGINFPDDTCQNITLCSPSLAGSASLGIINETYYFPTLVAYSGVNRLYASGSQLSYYVDYRSQYNYAQSMAETVNGGGSSRVIRTYGDVAGHNLNYVSGISGTTTAANNLRGTATFVAATTVTVSFSTAEPDASYTVALGGNSSGYCWVTSKGTSGFTINCSASNSNAVDWVLIR